MQLEDIKKGEKIFLHDDIEVDVAWKDTTGINGVTLKNNKTGDVLQLLFSGYSDIRAFRRMRSVQVDKWAVNYQLGGKDFEEIFDDSDSAYNRKSELEKDLDSVKVDSKKIEVEL